ncbi:L,D-transpeptidase [Sphingopyxis indica]|uniref:L,D-transpeptidase n=1 Tax=Sphingopyxis indica TaxID=436663 RepID=UPI0029392E91|nr:L,D-transpeptidase [Sphingopyxis indica]
MTDCWKRHVALAIMSVLLFGAPLAPLPAQQPIFDTNSVLETIERLKPGEYIWAPDIAPTGPVLIIVSLANQRAVAYRNGVPIGVSTVSTGKPGYETPTGIFTILQKDVDHRSNLYDDAPMPYMQRLTWGGVALHGGNLPGYPASHGCIRLPLGFAKQLYGITRLGLTVVITKASAVPRLAPVPDPLRPTASDIDDTPSPEKFTWHPERSPSGPVSIVVSTADRRMIVLRNGRQIGSASIAAGAAVDRTTAYTLRAIDNAGLHWLRIPLSGETPPAQDAISDSQNRFRVAEEFRRAVAAVLSEGTTVLVTNDSLARSQTGRELTVITGEQE